MTEPMTERPSWPWGPAKGCHFEGDPAQDLAVPDQVPAQALIGEMARLLRDTRGNMLTGGCMLGAITIGIAVEAAFSARTVRPDALGVNTVVFGSLLLCWLRALMLLAVTGRPVLNAVSELRWETGAPLDPRAPWLTLPATRTWPEEWTWIRAHLLLGAARLARYRSQQADTWTFVTAASFLLWTAVSLLGL